MISLPPTRLKELLLKAGVVDAEAFSTVEEEANRKRQNVIDLLISKGLLNKDYFYVLLADAIGVPRINLGDVKIDEGVMNLIPEDVARQRGVILFGKLPSGVFQAAMEDPTDLETIDFLNLRLHGKIEPYLATDEDLNRGFLLYHERITQDFKKIIEESIKESLHLKVVGDLKQAAEDIPIVAIVDNLLSYAISSRSSDIHFEALDDVILVRFRIDGVLHEIIRMPKQIHPAITARIKILSGLRVDEHTHPQDGRFRYKLGENLIDVRVSIIPTFYGEKVEMRLLNAAQKPISLAEIGMFDDTIKFIKEGIAKTYGMVLVCGPTGSGKTTTLYSIMNILNRPEVNIVTIEDPIEYDMRYVNQTQVNVAAGITFASGLRSILRQDPNIIMVGEIRDTETANISVQSALTGHLVLSSIHTNDAPTAIPRLIDIGVPPFLVSAVVNVICAQRLTRRIHIDCVESYTPDSEMRKSFEREIKGLGVSSETQIPKTFYRGKGCSACNFTGFLGRVGIFEAMEVTEEIRKVITGENLNLDSIRELARKQGMVTMLEDGLRKVQLGITTIEEVFRVIRE
ncbi:MAG: General secretory pathway protein E [Candidatus Jorgensenbacteria bacterium GW2011_GWA2_45_13]|uniref:General secretory pathway protein E n=1 Tax=Candidatus Jorgensenbacteria bacterium GW2011_GWA2_45_13 TaxID=1618662 RepID=A0A0G1L8D2_9BACT|nr:MAG: General secretory pathway protein E [Candidatus Jorgensenbacteria bacterium GW2011_GWA2_45_13]